jgi:phage-related protein
MTYVIDYYNSSVKKEIDGWPKGINACFLRITKQMERSGPNLGLPYTRPFGDGLFEIRAKGPKTPLKELNLARKRQKEIHS